MSHIAVKLVADRLNDVDEGINTIALSAPGLDGPFPPPPVLTVYNELDHAWVARRRLGGPEEASDIVLPCIVVYLASLTDNAGIARYETTGARTTGGTLTVVAQLLMRNVETAAGLVITAPLLRALRGVFHRFNEPSAESAREADGTRLAPATSMQQGDVKAFVDDTVISPGALLITFPFLETVPLT